jgi:HD superfamily phosphohydrolase
MVYHGAEHTRFQHAIGAFHLMGRALEVLKNKGVKISGKEEEAAQLAILLHDIGHGPYSHSLERILLPFHHEEVTLALLNHLNKAFKGKLKLAISIFTGDHPKGYLHELVSSQLDMDRLDYLNRDRFFTGVYEGVIGYDRIIHMLNVKDGRLVVEEKGIYSVEKFIVARRLMYWQVYLHRTSLSAETMLGEVFRRAAELAVEDSESMHVSAALLKILVCRESEMSLAGELLDAFIDIDDYDIFSAIKTWRSHPDLLLSYLCQSLYNRKLFKTRIGTKAEIDQIYKEEKEKLLAGGQWDRSSVNRLVHKGKAENSAYKSTLKNILISGPYQKPWSSILYPIRESN